MSLPHHTVGPLVWGAVIATSLVAAVSDLRSRRIPNVLTGPVFLAGLIYSTWRGGLLGLADGFGGCLLLAMPYVLLFVFANGAAGDAKLMAAVGAWLGVANGAAVLFAVAISGGVLGILFAIGSGRLKTVASNLGAMCCALFFLAAGRQKLRGAAELMPAPSRQTPMPYGPAIFAGICLAALGVNLWHV